LDAADGYYKPNPDMQGIGHAFANPSGANYAPQQTADTWNKTLAFIS
jgi:dienelactone hydrolase